MSIDNESIDFLIFMIEAEPTITIMNLDEVLRETFPRELYVSNVTVSRTLSYELSLKLCHNLPQNRNSVEVTEAGLIFAHYIG